MISVVPACLIFIYSRILPNERVIKCIHVLLSIDSPTTEIKPIQGQMKFSKHERKLLAEKKAYSSDLQRISIDTYKLKQIQIWNNIFLWMPDRSPLINIKISIDLGAADRNPK